MFTGSNLSIAILFSCRGSSFVLSSDERFEIGHFNVFYVNVSMNTVSSHLNF